MPSKCRTSFQFAHKMNNQKINLAIHKKINQIVEKESKLDTIYVPFSKDDVSFKLDLMLLNDGNEIMLLVEQVLITCDTRTN